MLAYWLLLAFFAIGAIVERTRPSFVTSIRASGPQGTLASFPQNRPKASPLLIFGALVTAMMIGLRYKVGGDWYNYIEIFQRTRFLPFSSALKHGDPGYQAINWFVAHNDYQIWLVNLVAGAVFSWGLARFSAVQPRPWLAFAIAIPYLTIVVAMGYTRQAIALGILMAGLAQQARGATAINFAVYVAAAALFHSTAVVMFPIVAWSARGNRFVNAVLVVAIGIMFYRMFLGHTMDTLVTNYLDAAYSSQGALVRVSMNMLAAAAFFLWGRRLGFSPDEYRTWRNISFAACVMLVLLAVLPSSTAVDRISLYILPLQLAVLSRIPLLTPRNTSPTVIAVLGYVTIVQFVWLNYAQFSDHWVPYRLFQF